MNNRRSDTHWSDAKDCRQNAGETALLRGKNCQHQVLSPGDWGWGLRQGQGASGLRAARLEGLRQGVILCFARSLRWVELVSETDTGASPKPTPRLWGFPTHPRGLGEGGASPGVPSPALQGGKTQHGTRGSHRASQHGPRPCGGGGSLSLCVNRTAV